MALTLRMALNLGGFRQAASGRTQGRPAASKTGQNRAGRTKEPRRKPRAIGDVEVDEPLHGPRNYALFRLNATPAQAVLQGVNMVSALRSLALSLLCLALAGPVQAAGESLIFLDLPKGIGIAPDGNGIVITVCPDHPLEMKHVALGLTLTGRSTLQNGKQRISLDISRSDQGQFKALLSQAEARGEPDCLIYSLLPRLCRTDKAGLRFTTADWGVNRKSAWAEKGAKSNARLQIDKTLPECES